MMEKQAPLAACIILDIFGYFSYSIPLFGEWTDIIWAPVAALIYIRMFGKKTGLFGGAFTFLEEILPGTDFIPTFTLTWIWKSVSTRNKLTQIG
jgi:hypothetical protein